MRAVAIHSDVVVATSRAWRTTCTAIRGGEEAFVVDSPVFPDELELLPALTDRARFRVRALLATHADWDHLLGRLAFPEAQLGAAETTAARLNAEPGAAARDLRAFDDEHYVARTRPLSLPGAQPLPVPGHCAVGDRELDLHPADGHTPDGMAIVVPWARVVVCGDYLSPVEIPVISAGGSPAGYEATLRRLRPLVEAARWVVPGHGEPLEPDRALELLEADLAYLAALRSAGAAAPLPRGRDTPVQRRIHGANAARWTTGE